MTRNSFLNDVAIDIVSRFGENLKDCAIVFNNKRPQAFLQQSFSKIINKPFWSPSFFTIDEFIKLSTNFKQADFFTQFFILYKIYNETLEKEGENRISINRFYGFGEILLNDFAAIDLDLVDYKKIFSELEDISIIEKEFDFLTPEQQAFLTGFWKSYSEGKQKQQQKNFIKLWRRMPSLYERFHESLNKKGFITTALTYRQAAENPSAFHNNAFHKIIFVGFNALKNAEIKLFQYLQKENKAVFYFDADPYFVDDPLQEAGFFLRKNFNHNLINSLPVNQSHLRENMPMVNVYKVEGHSVQAKILDVILKEEYIGLTQQESSKTAVVLADETLLFPVLQTIPTMVKNESVNAELPVHLNITMGLSYNASAIFGLTQIWMDIQKELYSGKETISIKLFENFLFHPLLTIDDKSRENIFGECLNFNYVNVPVVYILSKGELFQLFFKKTISQQNLIANLKNGLEYILRHLNSNKNLRKIDAAVFLNTIRALNRLEDMMREHYNETTESESIEFILQLIRRVLQSVSVPLSGSPTTGLQVMGLLESRSLNFEHVVLLGFNEGVIPKASNYKSFIPDSVRRSYGLPVPENQDAVSAYMFYRLINRAKKISIVYNAIASDNKPMEPGRFLQQLEFESGWTFNYFLQKQNIFVEKCNAVSIPKTPAVKKILDQFLKGNRTISPSAITTYIGNPIDFFFTYIAKINEPDEISDSFEAKDIGLIVHSVMEDFYKAIKAQHNEVTKAVIKSYRENIGNLIKQKIAKQIFRNEHHEFEYSGMQKVVASVIEHYIKIILDFDELQAPFKILELEKKIEPWFDFTMPFGVPQKIKFKGIIDRVDEKDGVIRIVDYKTGSDSLKFSDIESCFDSHTNKLNKALVQILIYTCLYENEYEKNEVEPNLYVISEIKNGNSKFKAKNDLVGETLRLEKEKFKELLKEKLAELFNEKVAFYKSNHKNNYAYSKFIELMEH